MSSFGQLSLRVDFSQDKTGGCSPVTVSFNSSVYGANGAASYQWDFGNGNTAITANPEAIYTDVGTYTITLTVTAGGSSATATHTVTVYPAPTASFTVSPVKVCGTTPVSYTSTSQAGAGSISNYLWDFGDGSTQEAYYSPASHSFQAAGTYNARLTVTNSYGCTASASQNNVVKVLAPLTADFSVDKRVLCVATDPVQFTNNSSGPGTLSYSWSFGDGSTSTIKDPGYAYTKKGTYSVNLTTTSSEGCVATSTQLNYLNVANYTTDFSVPGTVCQGTYVTFTDNSNPTPNSENWSIDGTPYSGYYGSLSYVASTPGTHTITLANLFGACPQSASRQFTVNAVPVIPVFDMKPETPCGAPATVDFTDHTVGAVSWSWAFDEYNYNGNGTSPTSAAGPATSYRYSSNNQFAVSLTVKNAAGCSSSTLQYVSLYPPSYSITETNSTSSTTCNQPITKSFTIPNSTGLKSWTWDFGDGTTAANVLSPTHTWTRPGGYQTVLRWTDVNGCSGTVTGSYLVISQPLNPVISVTSTTVCINQQVTFNSSMGDASSYVYNFGDGNSLAMPYHIYSVPGTYTVSLYVQNAGCQGQATATDLIKVLPAPGGNFSAVNTCDNNRDLVTLTYSPTGPATNTATWNFGDGSSPQTVSGTTTTVPHTYPRTGAYTATVYASNGTCATTTSLLMNVLTKQSPVLSVGLSSVCQDGSLPVTVTIQQNPANVFGGRQNDYSVAFLYGDGTPYTGTVSYTQNVNNTLYYTLYGFQTGKGGLQVRTISYGFGCTDLSNIVPLTIKAPATAGYAILSDDHCYQQAVTLQDNSTVLPGNTILSRSWDFGDGGTSTETGTVAHTYAYPGSYQVQLSVTDASGCINTSTSSSNYVSVNGPLAAFYPSGTDVHLNTTVYFSNTSYTYGSPNTQWSWDFGDGSTSTDFSPNHTYPIPGVYNVVLTATDAADANTCGPSVARATITVEYFNPYFQLSTSYVTQGSCPPVLAQFTNTSLNYTSVSWDFGDGFTAGNVNYPSHLYKDSGNYIVTLTVNGYNGLIGKYTDTVKVRQPRADLFALGDTKLCAGQAGDFKTRAQDAVSYTWDFGDGTVSANAYPDSVILHNYPTGGDYEAKVIVTDKQGCTMAAQAGIEMKVNPLPVVVISPDEPYVCKGSDIVLTASGGSTYSWSPATGLNRTDIAAPTASPDVTTTYQIVATDDIGCQGTGSVSLLVVQKQTLAVDPDSTAICDGDATQLHASGTDVYDWTGDQSSALSDIHAAQPTAKPTASTTYTVFGSDSHSCFTERKTVIVTVLPLPTVDAGPDLEVLAANPILINAIGSPDIATWQWTPADYLNCDDCGQPIASPKKPETYVVTVTGQDGCKARDSVNVGIICKEVNVRIPEAFTPNGDGNNDRFVILGIGAVEHLVIYDRWGVKVFERDHYYPADAGSDWDGNFHGHPAATGTYAYFVEFVCPAGGLFTKKGTVVLIR
jgi:gliding motility-associated-like protein